MTTETWEQRLLSFGAACFESPEEALTVAQQLGRVTDEEVLRPRPAGAGWSLSDAYGHGAFPWHTDAAVALFPPRWFVLTASTLSEPTHTEVLLPAGDLVAKMRRTPLRVHSKNGRTRYLPAAVPEPHGHRLRWDPRVASPAKESLLAEVEATQATCVIEWRVGLSVIIDNHRVLHRRPAVGESERTLSRYYVWSN